MLGQSFFSVVVVVTGLRAFAARLVENDPVGEERNGGLVDLPLLARRLVADGDFGHDGPLSLQGGTPHPVGAVD
jgi:hypothetical protein